MKKKAELLRDFAKMKEKLCAVLVLAACMVVASSCKKDSKIVPASQSQYSMNFTVSAGKAPLVISQNVTGVPYKYNVSVLRYYIGFARLEKSDGTEVPLANLLAVQFDDPIDHSPVFGTSFSFKIPAGTYMGIKFGVGIPPALDTVQYLKSHNAANDPLNQGWGMVWTMKDIGVKYYAYRNIAIYMYGDTSKAQNEPVNRGYEFHILNDNDTSTVHLYSDLFFPDAFTVGNGDNHAVTINLDFNKVLFNPLNPIDLRNAVSTSMFNNDPTGLMLGEAINKNFYSALTLKQE